MFRPFFRPFLGTVVKNSKKEKVAPGIYLNSCNTFNTKIEVVANEVLGGDV